MVDPQSARTKTGNPPVELSIHIRTSALGIPFQVSNNFVLVQLRVNNSRPLWFLFSTASTSVIDTRVAKELGLVTQSQEKSTATGSDISVGSIAGVSLALLGVKTLNQIVGVLSLDFISSVLGQPVAGIIGYDFISQFVIEVDYANRKLNVYAPAAYRYSGAGDPLPIKFIDKRPFITVRIAMGGREGVEGTFELETATETRSTDIGAKAQNPTANLSRIEQALAADSARKRPLVVVAWASR